MDTFRIVIVYSLIFLIFFGIGKIISKINKPLFKNIFKTKRNNVSSDIMVNNYCGNMISVVGAILIAYIAIGPTSFSFYGITAIAIIAGYVMHIADASGLSIDNAINVILNGQNASLLRFMQATICAAVALVISGYICSNYIADKIIVENKQQEEQYPFEDDDPHMTTKDKEKQFYEDIKEFLPSN